ncbi:hypothetical protein [Streptomyces sp. NPDC059165]|uniref:hypothetical protein n=1 Tax=Streptomyces sp. NPDC059165 TaxID=3346751 RepID=UPI00368D22EA
MLFTLRSSYSGKTVRGVFATASQEMFCEGHVEAFEVLGGVPRFRIRCDNGKPAVKHVMFGRPPTREPPASPRGSAASNRTSVRCSVIKSAARWASGTPEGTGQLKARITILEQQIVTLELELRDQDDGLAAARTANRELMAQLNRPPG